MPAKGPGGGASLGSSPLSQTPEKSGLPSAVRGAGAAISTRPSAVRGAEGFLKDGHCARRVAGTQQGDESGTRDELHGYVVAGLQTRVGVSVSTACIDYNAPRGGPHAWRST